MLASYVVLALIFIFGLIFTKFLNFPAKSKFAAWFQSPSLQNYTSKMVQTPPNIVTTTTASCIANDHKVMKGANTSSYEFKAELKSVFATFDKNGDGYITKQELKESLKNIGITMSDNDVKEMVERVDCNGDGLIDLDEFCELFESIMSKGELVNGERNHEDGKGGVDGVGYLKEAFDVFDGDGDGVITVDELGQVLSSLGFKEGKLLENCREMIRKVDMDGDGMINFEEFELMMKSGKRLLPVS